MELVVYIFFGFFFLISSIAIIVRLLELSKKEKWIKRIIGFIRLYKDYEYEPETWRHIVETYQQVLCNRTRTMSKPTYYIQDILTEMDKWYEYHDEYECGREYVSNYGKCPMCTDCPDNCPLDKKGE